MNQIDKEIDNLEAKMAVFALHIEAYGYAYWPLFERLDAELRERKRMRNLIEVALSRE